MNFPAIDPIAFTIGPLAVRWYSLSYIIGILIGLILINKFIITYKKKITKNDVFFHCCCYENIYYSLVLTSSYRVRGYIVFETFVIVKKKER